jgi:hypothetical protein
MNNQEQTQQQIESLRNRAKSIRESCLRSERMADCRDQLDYARQLLNEANLLQDELFSIGINEGAQ